jgi:GTP-binding protein EngB required for normal cell division
LTAVASGTRGQDLTELLRKCHRDELEPLAKLLDIASEGRKLSVLATLIDHGLRRAATSEVANLLRRFGRPAPYLEVLEQVGMRMGLEVPRDVELAELAIVRREVSREWDGLPEADRAARWAQVAGDPPIPLSGADAIDLLERKHPQGFGLFLSRLVTEPPIPLPGCLVLLWLGRPRDDLAVPAIVEVSRLRHTVRHRVTVGVVGSPSSGKDAAIGALFGLRTGNVDPVAGSTKAVEIRRLPGSTALYVVNTPGLGDVIEAVTEEARQVLDHIDVYVYLVNAQGGVQAREKADYAACRARGRPVLAVVNKVDTLRPADRERFLEDCRAKLAVDPRDFLAAAFDPLPQLSEAPLGLDAIRGWIEQRLEELGKDRRELPWVPPEPAIELPRRSTPPPVG